MAWSPWGWRGGWRGKGGWGGWGQGWGQQALAYVRLPEGARPLAMMPPGSRGRIVAIVAGPGAMRRAYSLGLTPGVSVEVVENNPSYPWTPVIVRVHGMEVAVGRGLASKIYVVPEPGAATGGSAGPS